MGEPLPNLKAFILYTFGLVLWAVASFYIGIVLFGEVRGNVVYLEGWRFLGWFIVVIAIFRATGIRIEELVREIV